MTIRTQITNILNFELISNKFIELDLWILVHFFFGGLIMYLLLKRFKKFNKKIIKRDRNFLFLSLFSLLILYEIVEFFLIRMLPQYFLIESLTNIMWDITIGLIGGYIIWLKQK